MDGQELSENKNKPIVRIGDTVHRPVSWWTPAVHSLLKYLEDVDFKYSPRVLGFDEQGREILSFIAGESGKEGWSKIISDDGLRRFAKLLRGYHDVISGFKPLDDSEWAYAKGAPKTGEIMCHGDFGPWNVVWQGDEPVGIVDWDFVLPAKPEYDILYGLEYSVPFRDDKTSLTDHHFPEVPDRKHRIEIFLGAYGAESIENVAGRVAQLQRTVGAHEEYLAKRGLQPQADWVAHGDLERIENWAQWTEANKHLFE